MSILSGTTRLLALGLALAVTTPHPSALAADYPSRPLMIMVPYPAGGISDSLARTVAPHLSRGLGQTVLVENLGGVSGALGARKVLEAPADGHYLLQGSPNELVLAPIVNPAVELDSEDFRLVQLLGTGSMVIAARQDLPAHDADSLVRLIRERAASTPLTFGSVGVGSLYHLLGEHLANTLKTELVHVPYRGGAPLMQDLVGGQVDFTIMPLSQQQVALAEQGRIKLLATIDAERSTLPGLSGVPSVNESESLRGFNFITWTGYFVRRDTPEAVVETLKAALDATLAAPEVRDTLGKQNLAVATPLDLAAAEALYRSETEQFRTLAGQIDLTASR